MKKLINNKFKLKKKSEKEETLNDVDTTKVELDGSTEQIVEDVEKKEKAKTTKEEIAELLKPIAIHEAKSAFYKAKLVKVVVAKGAEVAAKTSKKAYDSWKTKKSSK